MAQTQMVVLAALVALALAPAAVFGAAEATGAAEVCNGVPGLCSVPVGKVLFLGTHNSAAVAHELACPLKRQFANQAAPILAQVAAGARALNLDADLKGGALVLGHGFCANGATRPRALFDALGGWLAAHPSEALVLHVDDNQKRGDPEATAEMLLQLEAALAASKLGPLLAPRPLTAATPLRALRGKAAVVVDAGGWGGGGVWGSEGLWLKAWAEAGGGPTSYVGNPAAAASTRDAVAASLVAKFSDDAWAPRDARCGSANGGVPFRSLSFGSADWSCQGGGGLNVCQLPLLAAATNTYAHIASTLRATGEVCGAAWGAAAAPGANVVFLDFFPPNATAAAAALGPAQLVQDWNTAAAAGYRGCSWGGGGGGSPLSLQGSQIQCAGVASRRLGDATPPAEAEGAVVVPDGATTTELPLAAPGSGVAPAAAGAAAGAANTALQSAQAAAASVAQGPAVSGAAPSCRAVWTVAAAAVLAAAAVVV